jgi:hypothetical protein
MEMETDMETETEWAWTWTYTRHGHGIWELLLSISYGANVPIALYGMPLKYHSAISNGAIYL